MPAIEHTGLYQLHRGSCPVLVNVPHAGTRIPPSLADRLTPQAADLPDTDWHVERLYDFVGDLGVGMMAAVHSRYAIDLNRPPGDEALYTTRSTGLVPIETFAGAAVYIPGTAPGAGEVQERIKTYWQPYHEALQAELDRLHEQHGHAILLDAHSIRSEVPALFTGRLPVLNLGSNSGASAGQGLLDASVAVLAGDKRWDLVVDGRFRGGYITRHYGRPQLGFHALQLEMAQRAYMDEDSRVATQASMRDVRSLLQQLVLTLANWRPEDD